MPVLYLTEAEVSRVLTMDLALDAVSQLASALAPAFYVDEDAVRDAVERRSSFNAIHQPSGHKVDVFVDEKISTLLAMMSLTLQLPSSFPSHSGPTSVGLKIAWLIATMSETVLRPSPF